jgi:hypothetical protein
MWFSPAPGGNLKNSAPFASVALAGHTLMGAYCDCGSDGCSCDPGEVRIASSPSTSDQVAAPTTEEVATGADIGAGAMVLALLLIVGLRLRF